MPNAPVQNPPEVPYLGLFDLYAYLGLVRVMEPETEILMRERAERERRAHDYGPHERPWFISFHGSQFPGEPQSACQRKLLYTMMDLPESEIVPPWVTTTGKIGKAGELDLADAWWQGGRLLAVPEDPDMRIARLREALEAAKRGQAVDFEDIHQLGFVDNSLWFTVSTDLPILQKGWRRPHIVEVKCKADDVLEEMIAGRILAQPDGTQRLVGRGPDAPHVNQLKATIGQAHEYDWGRVAVCSTCWFIYWAEIYERLGLPGGMHPFSDSMGFCPRCQDYGPGEVLELEPPTSGEVYYWSRAWPRKTKSFYYEYDRGFMDAGRLVLAETRQAFLDDVLPPRPDHFQWSVGPCATCPFKPTVCRPDAGVPGRKRKPDPKLIRDRLSQSNGIEYARSQREDYDYDKVRARVLEEWS